jgi:outer membrane protein OmpA-like peptidoglycan-associated protein
MGVNEDGGMVKLMALEPSKTYRFNVRAHNSSGYGSSSNKSASIQPLAVPGKVTEVKASAAHDFVMITWMPAPATPNTSAAASYSVVSQPDGRVLRVDQPPAKMFGLCRKTDYRFTVQAHNAVGSSAPSDSSEVVVLQELEQGADSDDSADEAESLRAGPDSPQKGGTVSSDSEDEEEIAREEERRALDTLSQANVSILKNAAKFQKLRLSLLPKDRHHEPTPKGLDAPSIDKVLPYCDVGDSGGLSCVTVYFTEVQQQEQAKSAGSNSPKEAKATALLKANTPTAGNRRRSFLHLGAVSKLEAGGKRSIEDEKQESRQAKSPKKSSKKSADAQLGISMYVLMSDKGHTVSGGGSPLVIKGLKPHEGYTFSVVAMAGNGEVSRPSMSSSVVMPAALPGMPRHVRVQLVREDELSDDEDNDHTHEELQLASSVLGSSLLSRAKFGLANAEAAKEKKPLPMVAHNTKHARRRRRHAGGREPVCECAEVHFHPPRYDGNETISAYTVRGKCLVANADAMAHHPAGTAIAAFGGFGSGDAASSSAKKLLGQEEEDSPKNQQYNDVVVTRLVLGSGNMPISPIRVYGLDAGCTYTFTVTATNRVGLGHKSKASMPVSPATVPGVPTNLQAVNFWEDEWHMRNIPPLDGGGDGADHPLKDVKVTFEAPGWDGGNGVKEYKLVCTPINSSSTVMMLKAKARMAAARAKDAAKRESNSELERYLAVAKLEREQQEDPQEIGEKDASLAITSVQSPMIVTGIPVGADLKLTLVASNRCGESVALHSTYGAMASALPGCPSDVIARLGDRPETARVYFRPPTSDGGCPVLLYSVKLLPLKKRKNNPGIGGKSVDTEDEEPKERVVQTAGAPVLVDGLPAGVPYRFIVSAHTRLGQGGYSNPSGIVATATPPAPPMEIEAAAADGCAHVYFAHHELPRPSYAEEYECGDGYDDDMREGSDAAAEKGGLDPGYQQAVRMFVVRSHPDGLTACGSMSPITVSGLTNGRRYTFTVQARNALGDSTSSMHSLPAEGVVPCGVPSRPQEVTLLPRIAAAGVLEVRWRLPESNGGAAIESYSVRTLPDGRIVARCPAARQSIMLAAIAEGTTGVEVCAHNRAGSGPFAHPFLDLDELLGMELADMHAASMAVPSAPTGLQVFMEEGSGGLWGAGAGASAAVLHFEHPGLADSGRGGSVDLFVATATPVLGEPEDYGDGVSRPSALALLPETALGIEDTGVLAKASPLVLPVGRVGSGVRSPITFADLAPGVCYEFSVIARGSIGSSEPSKPVRATAFGQPDLPPSSHSIATMPSRSPLKTPLKLMRLQSPPKTKVSPITDSKLMLSEPDIRTEVDVAVETSSSPVTRKEEMPTSVEPSVVSAQYASSAELEQLDKERWQHQELQSTNDASSEGTKCDALLRIARREFIDLDVVGAGAGQLGATQLQSLCAVIEGSLPSMVNTDALLLVLQQGQQQGQQEGQQGWDWEAVHGALVLMYYKQHALAGMPEAQAENSTNDSGVSADQYGNDGDNDSNDDTRTTSADFSAVLTRTDRLVGEVLREAGICPKVELLLVKGRVRLNQPIQFEKGSAELLRDNKTARTKGSKKQRKAQQRDAKSLFSSSSVVVQELGLACKTIAEVTARLKMPMVRLRIEAHIPAYVQPSASELDGAETRAHGLKPALSVGGWADEHAQLKKDGKRPWGLGPKEVQQQTAQARLQYSPARNKAAERAAAADREQQQRQRLSQQRAVAIVRKLVGYGVPEGMLDAVGCTGGSGSSVEVHVADYIPPVFPNSMLLDCSLANEWGVTSDAGVSEVGGRSDFGVVSDGGDFVAGEMVDSRRFTVETEQLLLSLQERGNIPEKAAGSTSKRRQRHQRRQQEWGKVEELTKRYLGSNAPGVGLALVSEAQLKLQRVQSRQPTINFDENTANVSFESAQLLLELGLACKTIADVTARLNQPILRLRVEAHVHTGDTKLKSQRLSEERATAVVNRLVACGVPAEMLAAVGCGAARPIGTAEQNMRVEVHAVEEGAEKRQQFAGALVETSLTDAARRLQQQAWAQPSPAAPGGVLSSSSGPVVST